MIKWPLNQALTPNGWLKTGDLGRIDRKGRLWLLGRVKDMVKSGGENVFAPEVEEALCRHPNVVSAAVVGLPDERLGEKVRLLVDNMAGKYPPTYHAWSTCIIFFIYEN